MSMATDSDKMDALNAHWAAAVAKHGPIRSYDPWPLPACGSRIERMTRAVGAAGVGENAILGVLNGLPGGGAYAAYLADRGLDWPYEVAADRFAVDLGVDVADVWAMLDPLDRDGDGLDARPSAAEPAQ